MQKIIPSIRRIEIIIAAGETGGIKLKIKWKNINPKD